MFKVNNRNTKTRCEINTGTTFRFRRFHMAAHENTRNKKAEVTFFGVLLVFFCEELLRDRSSHRRCSVRKGVLRNFAKFTGKHLCQSLFFDKVAGLRYLFYRTLLGDCFWRDLIFSEFK